MAKSAADKLHDDIMKILNEYADEVDRKSAECVRKVSQKGALALRRVSPRKSGKYASGWTFKVEQKRLKAVGIIHNAKRPGLAHLLEYGHVISNGTRRVYGDVPAHVHIGPIETQLINDFERQIRVSIE